jgi:sec-independent protein translocase protein TatB
MFDLGWTELLLIGIVALIVVGPKDLPMLFRKVGQFVGKARGMAREFSRAMEDAADDTGVRDIAKSLKSVADPKKMGLDKIREATDDLKAWKPGSETAKLAEDRAAAARKLRENSTPAAVAEKAETAKATAEVQRETSAKSASTARKAATAPKPAAAPKAKATPKVTAAPKAKPAAKPRAKAKPADPTAQE